MLSKIKASFTQVKKAHVFVLATPSAGFLNEQSLLSMDE